MPLCIPVEVHTGRGKLTNTVSSLTGENVHGLRVAQTVTCRHGIGRVQLRVVIGENGGGDTSLRMVGV